MDVLGSIVLGGYILLMIFRLNATVSETTFMNGSELAVQTNLTTLVDILESDFRKIGYCADPYKLTDPSKAIISVNEHGIKYLTDVNRSGNVDTLEYYVSSTSALTATPNPRDFLLYRRINHNPPLKFDIGLTKFDFLFFNSRDDSIAFPVATTGEIFNIRLSVLLESSHPYDTTYTYAYWRQVRLAARNMRNR
jgi:hypothetical protein